MTTVVELKDVHKRFGANHVLRGVSFAIPKGHVTAIIGRSGSGKSTALRCIDRLEIIDSGSIQVCGHAVHDPAIDLRQLRQDVGIVFQSALLLPWRRVIDNILLQAEIRRLPMDAARARAAGAEVLGVVSIFTYGMKKGLERLAAADVINHSLSNLDALVEVAAEEGYIKPEDRQRLIAFRDNPSDESWINK